MSSGRCSGCRRPIVKGADFVLADTEVLHRGCIHLLSKSVVHEYQEVVSAATERANLLERRVQQLERSAVQAAQEVANAQRERLEVMSAHEADRRRLQTAQRDTKAARDEATALKAERQSLLVALGRVAPEDGAAGGGKVEDATDGTEKRFSLLELD